MLEVKVTITAATDLMAVLNNLATALDGKNPHTVCNQFGADNKHIDKVGTINMGAGGKTQPATPMAPVNPTPAQVAQPTAVPATIAPTANPTMPAPVNPTHAQKAPTVAPIAQPPVQASSAAPIVNPVPGAIPTAAPQYTLEMIATAGSALIDAGKMDQLMLLLKKFGVASLTDIDPNNYGAVANELRAMGAAI